MKLVMPAPTRLFATAVKNARKDVFCDGYTMGGGAVSGALIRHAEKYRVVMTPDAARTVRDDLEQVKSRGTNGILRGLILNSRSGTWIWPRLKMPLRG
jgi:uncharacterized protein (DUF1786 family)